MNKKFLKKIGQITTVVFLCTACIFPVYNSFAQSQKPKSSFLNFVDRFSLEVFCTLTSCRQDKIVKQETAQIAANLIAGARNNNLQNGSGNQGGGDVSSNGSNTENVVPVNSTTIQNITNNPVIERIVERQKETIRETTFLSQEEIERLESQIDESYDKLRKLISRSSGGGGDDDEQNLSFDAGTNILSIDNGNSVDLSNLLGGSTGSTTDELLQSVTFSATTSILTFIDDGGVYALDLSSLASSSASTTDELNTDFAFSSSTNTFSVIDNGGILNAVIDALSNMTFLGTTIADVIVANSITVDTLTATSTVTETLVINNPGVGSTTDTIVTRDGSGNIREISPADLVAAFENITSISTSTGSFTYTDEDGATTTIDIAELETTTAITFNAASGTIVYTDEDGATTTLTIGGVASSTDELITDFTFASSTNTLAIEEAGNIFDVIIDALSNITLLGTTLADVITANSITTTDLVATNATTTDLIVQGNLLVSGTSTIASTTFTGVVDFGLNEAQNFRVENLAGTPTCDIANLGRQYYDTVAQSGYICEQTGTSTFVYTDITVSDTTAAAKVVTVGTGGNFSTIAAAATYLNGLTGGIILLTPEVHPISTVVSLENIQIIGSNPGASVVQLVGASDAQVENTIFENLSINVSAALVATHGLDVQQNPGQTTSVVFNWVDFTTASGKVLLNSTETIAPNLNARFTSPSAVSGTSKIVLDTGTANLGAASTLVFSSQGDDGLLDIEDWDVVIAGASNVLTSGTITTTPDNTIFAYPESNLQAIVDSLPNGGIITLLPGVHPISEPLQILNDNIQISGYGDSSIIRASGFVTTGVDVGAIQVGTVNGVSPVNGTRLDGFRIEVDGDNIHGIKVIGGQDNSIFGMSIEKTSGTGGTGGTATMGIQMTDSASAPLVRPVIKNTNIKGDTGRYFTEGVHVTGSNPVAGIFGFGNGVQNALMESTNVDFVRESPAVFFGVSDSSLFNNRFTRMGGGGGAGPIGIFMGSMNRVTVANNIISGSLSTGATGIGVEQFNLGVTSVTENSVFSGNIIDGEGNGGLGFANGIVVGASTNTTVRQNFFQLNQIKGSSGVGTTNAITINGASDQNSFSNNTVSGGTNVWTNGINLASTVAVENTLRGNIYNNVTVNSIDNGIDTKVGVATHRAVSDPTPGDDADAGYSVGGTWVNTIDDTFFMLADGTPGAAIWTRLGSADDSAIGNGTVVNSTLRWDGSDWTENLLFTADDSGNATSTNSFFSNVVSAVTGLFTNVLVSGTATTTDLFVNGDAELGFMDGSVVFDGVNGLTEDNTNFFWDDTNKRLGIGTDTPVGSLDVQGLYGSNLSSHINVGQASEAGRINFARGTDGLYAAYMGYSSAAEGVNFDIYNQSGGSEINVITNSGGIAAPGGFNVKSVGIGNGTHLTVRNNGNVGIGTTTPTQELSVVGNLFVTDNSGIAQGTLAFDAANIAEFNVDALGNLDIDASGDVTRIPSADLQVCEGGACPTSLTNLASTTDGNAIIENDIYLGGEVISESRRFVASIHAEENNVLNNATYEYAFGNGGDGGVTGENAWGYVAALDGRVISLAFGCDVAGTNPTQIAVDLNNSGLVTQTVTAAANIDKANTVFGTPLEFVAGDSINFKTVLAGGAARCAVNSLVEFYP